MDENPQNDSQEVQPEQTEQPSEPVVEESTPEVNPEIAQLREDIVKKDEQIANLSKAKRELKKEVKANKSDGEEITNNQSDEFGYDKLAYLDAKGIKDTEVDFVKEELARAGGELKDLLANDYFQSRLKSQRDLAAVKDATPSNTRSGGESPSTKADFWISKGENPPNTPENAQLRREIVNKKMALAKHANQFAN